MTPFHYVERISHSRWTESLPKKHGYAIYTFTISYTDDVEFYAKSDKEAIDIIAKSSFKPVRLSKIENNKITTVYI